jgi:hypothetical protein
MSEKPNMHQSQVSLALNCGMAYYHRYVRMIARPPSVRMVEGTAVHRAGELNLLHKIDEGELLPESDVLDIARDALNTTWAAEGVQLSEEERSEGAKKVQGQATDAAVRMAQAEHRILAPVIEPAYVERRFRIEHPDLPFNIQGTIDTQEVSGNIRDRKTAKKSPPASKAHTSSQLSLYALAVKALDGTAPEKMYLDTIVDLKTGPKIITQETTREPEDYRMELDRMTRVFDAIQKGVFLPCNADNWMCQQKYCSYWQDECEFGRRGRNRMDN